MRPAPVAVDAMVLSEVDSTREAQFAARVLRRRGNVSKITAGHAAIGVAKLRCVGDIECLGAELQAKALGDREDAGHANARVR